ncbi:hypothetical protein M3Y94_01279300 [Aphelenchoides besseyi]|nr:hypothetical protein M3Y94_01279300 [Aphelenchoides besseyi]KAI6222724.1 hypothetical protein M3Y95_00923900 [Aphelenchoides besseyi]
MKSILSFILLFVLVLESDAARRCYQCNGLSDCRRPHITQCTSGEFGCSTTYSSIGLVKRDCLYGHQKSYLFLNGCMQNSTEGSNLICGCMDVDLCNKDLPNNSKHLAAQTSDSSTSRTDGNSTSGTSIFLLFTPSNSNSSFRISNYELIAATIFLLIIVIKKF